MNATHYKRIAACLLSLLTVVAGVFLVIRALSDSIHLYVTPMQLLDEAHLDSQILRLGGMVDVGTYQRLADGLSVSFNVSDDRGSVQVLYTGVLPALFREGQAIVAVGRWNKKQFVASELLAKHDEYYRPKELGRAD